MRGDTLQTGRGTGHDSNLRETRTRKERERGDEKQVEKNSYWEKKKKKPGVSLALSK